MASGSQPNDIPLIHPNSPENNDTFQQDTEGWFYFLYQLPKIISFFGSSDFNFHSLPILLKSPPQIIYKFRIMANKYSQLPFTRLTIFSMKPPQILMPLWSLSLSGLNLRDYSHHG